MIMKSEKQVSMDLCTPTCKYFRCSKRAMKITEKRGSRVIRVECSWAMEKCIGSECKFAYCVKRAMLPNNKCRLKRKVEVKSGLELEKEVVQEEEMIRTQLKKLGKHYREWEKLM